MHEPRDDIQELVRGARRVRELIWQDPHRPRFHLVPPEGFFNDPNGALFWRGRYHLFYLAREPIPHPRRLGEELWVAAWDHVSSRDLVHWIQHPPAIRPKPDGSTPMGIYSGGAIKNAPRSALIYHIPGQGTCIAVAEDDDLVEWRELPENPVIPLHREGDEYVVFDPAGWYEEEAHSLRDTTGHDSRSSGVDRGPTHSGHGTYCALIGNKNRRPGYEGDCTSLFTSPDATLNGISGNCMELSMRIEPRAATEVGLKVLCSPDNSEQTVISYLPGERKLQVDFRQSSLADDLQYWDYDPARAEAFRTTGTVQAAPFRLADGEALELRVFIDRSVIEVFANRRQTLTQRVYPTRADSTAVRLFATGGGAHASVVEIWEMEPVAPW